MASEYSQVDVTGQCLIKVSNKCTTFILPLPFLSACYMVCRFDGKALAAILGPELA